MVTLLGGFIAATVEELFPEANELLGDGGSEAIVVRDTTTCSLRLLLYAGLYGCNLMKAGEVRVLPIPHLIGG